MKKDVVIIGAGPAGIFTALEMLRKGSKKSILIVEKGKSVENRRCPKNVTGKCMNCKPFCHITTGFSGAGAFSDGKLSLSAEVGGDLPLLIGEELAQENARLFVAEAEGKVAGLAVFQLVCGEASLYAVSTAPAFRRQGVARALLSWAFAALCLQGAQDVFLEVRAQNSAAQALYRSLGFVQTGLRRNFYATPADDAVLMQKTL